jgi:hypothetical protein
LLTENGNKMLFIGGINSVLPYIIYLSLIWVFLIIGLSGKILHVRQLISARGYHADKDEMQRNNKNVVHFYDVANKKLNSGVQRNHAEIPWAFFFPPGIKSESDIPESFLAVYLHHHSAFGLRGPPAATFLF